MTQVDPLDDPIIREFTQETGNTREEVSYDDLVNSVEDVRLPVLGDNKVELPGGLLTETGLVRTVLVKELTGYDEEELARSDVKEPIDYLTKLLMLGVKEVGGKPFTEHLMRSLLVGDRNALILGIRRATFGNELNLDGLTCPSCDSRFDIIIELDEFEVKKLADPINDRLFEVKLLRTNAKVRIPTHGDIMDMLKASKKATEQNSVLLANCLVEIGGRPVEMNADGDASTIVRSLNMRDRALLIKEMDEHQPGPDLTGVKISCPSCDFEDSIGLDLISLFRL